MNTNLKYYLGSLALGVIAGAAGAWYLANRKYQIRIIELEGDIEYLASCRDKLKEDCSEKSDILDELQEVYSAIHTLCDENMEGTIIDLVKVRRTVSAMRNEGRNEEEITEAVVHGDVVSEYKNIVRANYAHPKRVERTEQESEDEMDDPNVVGDLRFEEPEENPEGPHLISDVEYMSLDYAKRNYTYFAADDTLCDDEDQDIIDPHELGIYDFLMEFEKPDVDAIYIQDDSEVVAYEIIWDEYSYKEIILGMNPESAVLLPRIFKRKES